MKTTNSRRWLLKAYPKGYRRVRGDEIIATLEELAPRGTRMRPSEVLSCLAHGARLRIVSIPPVVAAAVLFTGALFACVGVDLTRPSSYRADEVVLVGRSIASESALVAELHTSAVQELARSLSSTSASCTEGPQSRSTRPTLAVACSAGSPGRAMAAAGALVSAFNRLVVLRSLRQDATRIARTTSWLRVVVSRLDSSGRGARAPLAREIARIRALTMRDQAARADVALYGVQVPVLRSIGLSVVTYAAPGVEVPKLLVGDLLVSGSFGIAIGGFVAVWLRRRPVPRWA